MTEPHYFDVRVYYEDTDAAGIVYYANYLKFVERARTEMLREAGIGQAQLAAKDGIAFAVKSVAITYARPARLDDQLVIESVISELGGASAMFDQYVRRPSDGVAYAAARVGVACIRLADGKPVRFPKSVRETLARHIIVTKT